MCEFKGSAAAGSRMPPDQAQLNTVSTKQVQEKVPGGAWPSLAEIVVV